MYTKIHIISLDKITTCIVNPAIGKKTGKLMTNRIFSFCKIEKHETD